MEQPPPPPGPEQFVPPDGPQQPLPLQQDPVMMMNHPHPHNNNIHGMIVPPSAFVQDPVTYLSEYTTHPKKNGLGALAGPVAAWFVNMMNNDAPDNNNDLQGVDQWACMYLQAAAMQLKNSNTNTPTTTSSSSPSVMEQEILQLQYQNEVIEAVGVCATLCRHRRMAIAASGILPTLAHLMVLGQSSSSSNHNQQWLQPVAVEFLQCAVLCEHYRYAERLIQGTWPRPNHQHTNSTTTTAAVAAGGGPHVSFVGVGGTSGHNNNAVQMVLRYYYLRGMVHLGCQDWIWAHRCFYTCLSIPAETNSNIMIQAWKKLVLLQCCLSSSSNNHNNKPAKTTATIALPKTVTSCLVRLLTATREAGVKSERKSSSSYSSTTDQQQQQQSTTATSTTTRPGAPAAGTSSNSTMPATAVQQQQQQHKQLQQSLWAYMKFADAFFGNSRGTLEQVMHDHQATFHQDSNMGLIQSCQQEWIYHQVRQISQLYSIVPISKVANLLQIIPTTPDGILEPLSKLLVQSGVACHISTEDGMITFYDDDIPSSSSSTTTSLVDLTEWMQLLEKVQQLDVTIATSAKYHSLVMRHSQQQQQQQQLGTTGVGGEGAAVGKSMGGPRGVNDL